MVVLQFPANVQYDEMKCIFVGRKSHKKAYYRSDSLTAKNKQAKYLDNQIGGKSAARHEKDNDSLQVQELQGFCVLQEVAAWVTYRLITGLD